jgi:hypothetical protein
MAVVCLAALRFSDELVEHLSHKGRVSAHDGGGCRDVAVSVEVLPVKDEAGITGKLLEERALGSAVALAERVDTSWGRPRRRLSPCSAWKTSAAADSMYCGRQNQVPFAMATVRSCPAQS